MSHKSNEISQKRLKVLSLLSKCKGPLMKGCLLVFKGYNLEKCQGNADNENRVIIYLNRMILNLQEIVKHD